MTELPAILRKVPTIFYVLAAAYFLLSFGSTVIDANSVDTSYAPEMATAVRSELIRGFLLAAVDAILIAAWGVLFEFLIAFWNRSSNDNDGKGSE